MIKNTMPPQAYTRDTLVKAIDWIAGQPDSIRAQAKTADSVVTLYLQAKRRSNDWNADSNPISGETFKEDLKNLARDLEQFSGAQLAGGTHTSSVTPPNAQPPFAAASAIAPPTGFMFSNPQSFQPPQPTPMAASPQPSFAASGIQSMQWTVDPLSFKRAQSLKERLNLSSEGEALRMMIALGFEQLQTLLP